MSPAEARRIAVRAQLLDGSAVDVLTTVRRLGFLQLDPISTVAPPQHLVLWSRLGPAYDRAELDRLLWDERSLVEWNAFLWPAELLPALLARMHRPADAGPRERWRARYLEEHREFRRHVLAELERRGPLLGREIEDHRTSERTPHRWWGERKVGLMLQVLNAGGEVAVVGRKGNQRVWDLAGRWYGDVEPIPWPEAERVFEQSRLRSQGVVLRRGRWFAHPEVSADPVGRRVTFLSPFDQLVANRDRAESLWGFRYRLEMYVPPAKREYGYYVLPILRGDRLIGRIEPVHDRRRRRLEVRGVWWEPGVRAPSLKAPLARLARWLGAEVGATG